MKPLFDLSFERFVVPSLVRWLYVACLAIAGLVLIGGLAWAVSNAVSAQSDIDALVATDALPLAINAATFRRDISLGAIALAPLASIAIVILGRVAAEMTIVVFSIAESLKNQQP